MPWDIRLSREAEKQLIGLPRDRQEMIRKAIDRMSEDPFQGDVKPLKGKNWKGRYRKVVGRYRLILTPLHLDQERIVEVSAILLRSEKTYR